MAFAKSRHPLFAPRSKASKSCGLRAPVCPRAPIAHHRRQPLLRETIMRARSEAFAEQEARFVAPAAPDQRVDGDLLEDVALSVTAADFLAQAP